jgi:hypothetical protein
VEAAGLFVEGVEPPEVARRLRVSSKSAYQWNHAWRQGGVGLVRTGGAEECQEWAVAVWHRPATVGNGNPRAP